MAGSSLLSEPPANERDFYINRGFIRQFSLPIDPSQPLRVFPAAPPGYVPENRQANFSAGCIVVTVFMVLVTALRLCLRRFVPLMEWGADDWAIIPATLVAILVPIMAVFVVYEGGAGKHIWDITHEELNSWSRYGNLGTIFLFTTCGLVKISITLFLRRLTGFTSNAWRVVNSIFLGLLVAYTILAVCLTVFVCNPIPGSWSFYDAGVLDEPPTCVPLLITTRVLSILHVIFDFALLAMPIIILWRINMSATKKVRVCLLFCVGSFSCICGIMRDVYNRQTSPDVTWIYDRIIIWVLLDVGSAVLIANLPVISVLFTRNALRNMRRPVGSSQLSSTHQTSSSLTPKITDVASGRSITRAGTREEAAVEDTEDFEDNVILRPNKVQLKFMERSAGDGSSAECPNAEVESSGTRSITYLDIEEGAKATGS